MKDFLSTLRVAALAAAVALAAFLPHKADAQTVVQLPAYIDAGGSVLDLGNGPLQLKVMNGNAALFTSQSSGIGSTAGSSTTLTLTATAAANPPCVGCAISGTGITAGTTVAAFNGTTTITLSAAMTVAASTPLAWGMACPSVLGSNRAMFVQAFSADPPLYTYARICAAAPNAPGATVLTFPIGAH